MGCRANFFSILGAIALLWACGGVFWVMSATPGAAEQTAKQMAGPRATLEAEGNFEAAEALKFSDVGGLTAMAGLLSAPLFLCTGLPVAAICGYMAYRNRKGMREEERHLEQMEAYDRQVAVLSQSAMAQTAQAQMQFAQMQPQHRSPAALPAQSEESTRAQFQAVKALIQAKQYSQARSLLLTISHPTAKEWLVKLDKVERGE